MPATMRYIFSMMLVNRKRLAAEGRQKLMHASFRRPTGGANAANQK